MCRVTLRYLSVVVALATGCGIDLADGTERVPEEEVAEGATAHDECRANLSSLQQHMKSIYHDYVASGWVPSGEPTKNRRKWEEGSSFDQAQIGWKPEQDKVFGVYQITPKGSEGFMAACKADMDEDGEQAIWTVTHTSEPAQMSAEGVR